MMGFDGHLVEKEINGFDIYIYIYIYISMHVPKAFMLILHKIPSSSIKNTFSNTDKSDC